MAHEEWADRYAFPYVPRNPLEEDRTLAGPPAGANVLAVAHNAFAGSGILVAQAMTSSIDVVVVVVVAAAVVVVADLMTARPAVVCVEGRVPWMSGTSGRAHGRGRESAFGDWKEERTQRGAQQEEG